MVMKDRGFLLFTLCKWTPSPRANGFSDTVIWIDHRDDIARAYERNHYHQGKRNWTSGGPALGTSVDTDHLSGDIGGAFGD